MPEPDQEEVQRTPRAAVAQDPRPGSAAGKRRQHHQSLGAPDRQGGRARPRAGADRDRCGAGDRRPARRGPHATRFARRSRRCRCSTYARPQGGEGGVAPAAGETSRRLAAAPGRPNRTREARAAPRLWTPARVSASRRRVRTHSLTTARLRGRRGSRPLFPTVKDLLGGLETLTDFLTDYGILIALVCAGAAVLYGALVTQRLLGALARQRAHAGDLRRGAGGRQGLPQPPVPDHRDRRDPAGDPDLRCSRTSHGYRIRDRRRALRRRRLHRHEPVGPRERPRRRGGPRRRAAGARRRLQGRLGHRPARRRAGAVRRRRLLRHPARGLRPDRRGGDRRADRARLRRFADLRLRPTRRRHLHQGGRRRRRPRRQGRGRNSRGRPAQPGGDRRQRRRQRRRLRRAWRPTCSRPTR